MANIVMENDILIDTKNSKYEINGMDISKSSSITVTFEDGKWDYIISSSKDMYSNKCNK